MHVDKRKEGTNATRCQSPVDSVYQAVRVSVRRDAKANKENSLNDATFSHTASISSLLGGISNAINLPSAQCSDPAEV